MSTPLILAIVILPGLFAWWLLFRQEMEDTLKRRSGALWTGGRVDWEDVALTAIMGFCAAIMWPVSLPMLLVRQFVRSVKPRITLTLNAERFTRRIAHIYDKENT